MTHLRAKRSKLQRQDYRKCCITYSLFIIIVGNFIFGFYCLHIRYDKQIIHSDDECDTLCLGLQLMKPLKFDTIFMNSIL